MYLSMMKKGYNTIAYAYIYYTPKTTKTQIMYTKQSQGSNTLALLLYF